MAPEEPQTKQRRSPPRAHRKPALLDPRAPAPASHGCVSSPGSSSAPSSPPLRRLSGPSASALPALGPSASPGPPRPLPPPPPRRSPPWGSSAPPGSSSLCPLPLLLLLGAPRPEAARPIPAPPRPLPPPFPRRSPPWGSSAPPGSSSPPASSSSSSALPALRPLGLSRLLLALCLLLFLGAPLPGALRPLPAPPRPLPPPPPPPRRSPPWGSSASSGPSSPVAPSSSPLPPL